MRRSFLILALAACSRNDGPPIDDLADSALVAPHTRPLDSGAATRSCGITGPPILTDTGLGDLRPGRLVSEIAASCEIVSDSQRQGIEGTTERIIVVRIAGESVPAVVAGDRIFRVEINQPQFRTADSLGVDTPLREIASLRGAQFAPGEDGVYGFSADHCGLSFRFSVPLRPPKGGQWTAAAITEIHGDAAVNRVVVIPCRR